MAGRPSEWAMLIPGSSATIRVRLTPTGPGVATVEVLDHDGMAVEHLGRVEKTDGGRWLAIPVEGEPFARLCMSRDLAAGRLVHDLLDAERHEAGAR